jgi:hypothetical protein
MVAFANDGGQPGERLPAESEEFTVSTPGYNDMRLAEDLIRQAWEAAGSTIRHDAGAPPPHDAIWVANLDRIK